MEGFALEWRDILILAQLVVIVALAVRTANLVPQSFFKATFDVLREMAGRTDSALDDQLIDVFDKVINKPSEPQG